MRISTGMRYNNALYNVQSATERFDRAQQVAATGRRINRVSDDPAGMARALGFQSALDNLDQFTRNVEDARAFAGTTDSALTHAGDLLRQARTLTLQSINDTLDTNAREGIARQIARIAEQVATTANATYGSRYVFAGQRTTQPAFVPDGEGSNAYQGGAAATGDGDIVVEIGQNDPLTINVTGDRAFRNAFQALADLQANILAGRRDLVSDADLRSLDTAIADITRSRAEVGANLQRMDQAKTCLQQTKDDFTGFLSQVQDADIPKAVLELKTAETAYQSALTAAASGFQQSLLDFLK